MFGKIVEKIFGTSSDRAIKKIYALLEETNQKFEELKSLTDTELAAQTDKFRNYINEYCAEPREEIENLKGQLNEIEDPEELSAIQTRIEEIEKIELDLEHEALDNIMTEAFATVKEVCRRLVGKEFTLMGHKSSWNMVPYDVQILGAIVLHQGKIAEMATGEGKTLVSTMPLYLNALVGKGAHLVTVNDYLARRDAQWNSQIFEFLGLTVGCIHDQLPPHSPERREEYRRDITYGTNNQFGFDYLRDNMSVAPEDKVQRKFYYTIIDEVDSVLIDEARTPLIISGPVDSKIDTTYKKWASAVGSLVQMQTSMSNKLLAEAKKLLDDGKEDDAAEKLLMVQRSTPKNSRFLKIVKEPGIQKSINRIEAAYIRDKVMHELDRELFFAKEEKESSINLQEKGQNFLAPNSPETFVLPDLQYEIDKIELNEDLSDETKNEKKRELYALYSERSENIHAINTLLKAYTLFERDVDYVVTDGKVVIVDQFTGRLMAGRRFSDGLHQALEARENVKVEQETQTFATITIQNFFRLYKKLSGMTGTAITESQEFWEIYKLDVVSIPTNRPIARLDHEDVVYMTRREKYNAILDEIEREHAKNRPILVGTVSVDVSETLSRMLKRRGIGHSVLNAKHHEKEAEIVTKAGRPGMVTIATNMAGRGTDIKLGEGVPDAGGLHIIGSERHESRRIDNQLRGRAGRQGDPGSSRFFVSMEDDLMRLHAGGDRISAVMERFGNLEGEALTHPMVSSSLERAQKRVEMQNFSIRKHLLEYDDVMNQQRTVIYARRNEVLEIGNLKPRYKDFISDLAEMLIDVYTDEKNSPDMWDMEGLKSEFERIFLHRLDLGEGAKKGSDLYDNIYHSAIEAFEAKEILFGPEIFSKLMKWSSLSTIDNKWKEHLHQMDTLKEGIGLRSYAQKDPLIEYKREAFETFTTMLDEIVKETLIRFFHTQVQIQSRDQRRKENLTTKHESYDSRKGLQSSGGEGGNVPQQQKPNTSNAQAGRTIVRQGEKVGRNDPCPCGSGKKYKQCCGKQ